MSRHFIRRLGAVGTLVFSIHGYADSLGEIQAEIRNAVPESIPRIVRDSQGQARINPDWIRAFSSRRNTPQMETPGLFRTRHDLRARIRSQAIPTSLFRAKPGRNDDASKLVQLPMGLKLLRNLQKMEESNLTKYSFPKDDSLPWSDTYWPLYQGGLANRYADPDVYPTADWLENLDSHFPGSKSLLEETEKSLGLSGLFPALSNFIAVSETRPKEPSPAEKYDALLGDHQRTFTTKNWAAGMPYYYSKETHRKVERWMGLCHGWAPASFSVPRPLHSVTTQAPNGDKITFRPSDIKGLATSLWANGDVRTLFIGGRCNEEDPERDENGRITDPDCFDTNPATWHQVVTNQLGVAHRSFVMDANFDQEVWNQPVIGYSYQYVRLNTWKPVKTLREALLDRRKSEGPDALPPSLDAYHSYRPSVDEAPYVVGVAMTVIYGMETHPQESDELSWEDDSQSQVRYFYDLELNEDLSIVGGEWYESRHPDFLWAPVGTATTPWDTSLLGDWDPKTDPIPKNWVTPGRRSAADSAPLAHIVSALIQASRE